MGKKKQWTILTYIAAHNNLDEYGVRSAEQILSVGGGKGISHGVLLDLKDKASRFIAGSSGTRLDEEHFSDYDSGDPNRLIKTAKWLYKQYPAERYGLVLWSHGTGWQPNEIRDVASKTYGEGWLDSGESTDRAALPGSHVLFRTSLAGMLEPKNINKRAILFDDGTGHALDTLQLGRVTKKLSKFIGQKLDLVGMDACLMGSIEVAYQLRKYVNTMVASEELVPANSWPYDGIFKQLKQFPVMEPKVLADIIVQRYINYYTHHPPVFNSGDVTKIALDLSKIQPSVDTLRHLSLALIKTMPIALDCLEKAQTVTYMKETYDAARVNNKFNYHLWDIVSMARYISENCDVAEVRAAAADVVKVFKDNPMVLRSKALGTWFEGIGGMSVYWIPPDKEHARHISKAYAKVDYAKHTDWHQMLNAYRYPE